MRGGMTARLVCDVTSCVPFKHSYKFCPDCGLTGSSAALSTDSQHPVKKPLPPVAASLFPFFFLFLLLWHHGEPCVVICCLAVSHFIFISYLFTDNAVMLPWLLDTLFRLRLTENLTADSQSVSRIPPKCGTFLYLMSHMKHCLPWHLYCVVNLKKEKSMWKCSQVFQVRDLFEGGCTSQFSSSSAFSSSSLLSSSSSSVTGETARWWFYIEPGASDTCSNQHPANSPIKAINPPTISLQWQYELVILIVWSGETGADIHQCSYLFIF